VLQLPGARSTSEGQDGYDAKAVLLWVLAQDRKQHHQCHRRGEHSNDSNIYDRTCGEDNQVNFNRTDSQVNPLKNSGYCIHQNKKFLKERIVYFPLIRHGTH
jgi:hypothetical protein